MRERRLQFQREHPILYCLIVAIPVVLGFPLLIIGLMNFGSSIEYTFEFLRPADQIVRIQLIHVEERIGLYEHALEEIPIMLDDTATVVTEVDPSDHSAFLSDFASVPCHKFGNDPWPDISGGTILISYQDGSHEWIARYGTFYQDTCSGEASMTWFLFEAEAFYALLHSYGYP